MANEPDRARARKKTSRIPVLYYSSHLKKLCELALTGSTTFRKITGISGRPLIGPTSQTLLFHIYCYLFFVGIVVISKWNCSMARCPDVFYCESLAARASAIQ
jgi:hypothetical protein